MALPFFSSASARRRKPWTGPARVVIHCGFRKTGTTSIQGFLRLNAEALPINLSIAARGKDTEAYRRAVRTHLRKPSRTHLSRLKKAAEDLRDAIEADTADTVLISDENLFGADMLTEDGRTIFDLAAEYLPHLEAALADGPELVFVFYTRDRAAWLRSAYNQAVKRRGVTAAQDDWIAALPDSVDWAPGLERIRAALRAPVEVFAMEDDLSGPNPLLGRSLFNLAGLSDADLDRMQQPQRAANESLTPGALEFMRRLNGLDIPRTARHRVGALVERSQDLFA